MEGAFLVHSAVGMGAEVIALRLGQVGRQCFRAVGVEVSQRGAGGEHGDAQANRRLQHLAPGSLPAQHRCAEHRVHQQIGQLGLAHESCGDVAQERSADDAARAPHFGNHGKVELPVVLLRGDLEQLEALRVGSDLGGIQRLLGRGNQLLPIAGEFTCAAQHVGRGHPFLLEGRQHAALHGGAQRRDGHAQIERVLRGPTASAFLGRLVEDHIY